MQEGSATRFLGGVKSWRSRRLAKFDAIGRYGPANREPPRPWRWAGPIGSRAFQPFRASFALRFGWTAADLPALPAILRVANHLFANRNEL